MVYPALLPKIKADAGDTVRKDGIIIRKYMKGSVRGSVYSSTTAFD
jgi:hypothetical protein